MNVKTLFETFSAHSSLMVLSTIVARSSSTVL